MYRYLLGIVLVAGLGGCAAHVGTSGRVVIQDEHARVDIRFSDHDRRLIEQYYHNGRKRKGLPPGLAKRNGLPPGLAKRDRLPPGLDDHPLPAELEARLSRLPEGYLRVRVGSDIVLMDGKTRVILDVIYGVVP